MIDIIFDDKDINADEIFSLLEKMKNFKQDKYPAKNVFHCSLRDKEKELKSLLNTISITARSSNGELIGFLKLLTDYSYIFYILDVMVDPEYRNKGVGKQLVTKAVEFGKEEGFIKIFLTSLPGKESYYEQFGFKLGMSPVLTIRGEDYI
ncbi:hypothetical protein C0W42_21325 [Photobacterium kishitanii]|uniref:GNAT family N-acetyltransferase n=1 Tax=Photobacterium kishitanii TaxID=318456 RepID=UPI000D17864A|nr:GNAT family N-acetyltransferase [Photobacterium kishitanii]PSU85480.1 hypothetical protein C0W42_21325 [Photobacterium kishitanii]